MNSSALGRGVGSIPLLIHTRAEGSPGPEEYVVGTVRKKHVCVRDIPG